MISVAQIGIGYWGPNLLRNLVLHESCNVKKVIDISKQRCEFVKKHYPHIYVGENSDEIFNDDSIDAVIIATPVSTHYELAMRALQAGKHVLVEKPMAKTVEEVDEIGLIAQRKNLVAMVGHTFLYNSAVRYLKRIINAGELGGIRYIYSQRLNLGRIRSDVDALWNFAPHDISIIQYILNDPVPSSVVRYGMDYVQERVEDVVFMNIIYPNKIMAHVHVSWLDPHKVRRMTVVGSNKMAVYDDIAENKIAIYDKGIDKIATLGENMDFDTLQFMKFNHRSGDVILPKIHYEEPMKVEIAHFINCIQNGESCLTGPEHAKAVLQVLTLADQHERYDFSFSNKCRGGFGS